MPRERPIVNWDEVPVIIDVPYVARLLALNVDFTTRLAQRGVLPAHKIGKLWRFDKEEIRQYIKEHEQMWHLRNYPTRRKLLKDVENLRAENRHLSIELRNARTDLALENTASSGYRNENRTLRNKLKAYESSEPETIGFECVVVENANDYKVV